MTTAPNLSSPAQLDRHHGVNVYDLIGFAFVILSILCRFWMSLDIPLVADEAYYWEWSRHLAFSYYDQGPGVAFYIRLFTTLLGDSHTALKVAALSAALFTLIFFYLTTRQLGFSPARRLFALIVVTLLPGYFGGAILIMHDSPFMIAWAAALYFTIAYIKSGASPVERNGAYLFAIFACVGLGELAKHTMVFFAMSFAIWMFTDRVERRLLRDWRFWAGCLLSLAIISPILIWNANNNWDGVTAIVYLRSSMGSTGGAATAANYLVGQLLTFSPLWLLVFAGMAFTKAGGALRAKIQAWRAGRAAETRANAGQAPTVAATPSEIRFLWINALILPVFFLYLSASREIQGNWTFASFLACVLLLAGAIPENWRSAGTGARIAVVSFAIGGVFTIALDVVAYFSIPLVKFAENRYSIKIESYYVPGYRPLGFDVAINEILKFRDRVAPEGGLVAANRYQDAAVASWHLPGQPFVSSMNVMQRNQYNYWPGLERGRDYVVFYIHEKTCERSEVLIQPTLTFMFDEVEEFPEQDVVVDGAVVKRFQVYVARNYRRSWEDMVYNYFVRRSIQDMMPNLRGYYSEVDTKAGQADAMLALQKMRAARAGGSGCGIFGSL